MIDTIINTYLWLCFGVAIALVCMFAYQDVTRTYENEFGPNYRSAFAWLLIFFTCTPVINLIVLVWWIWGVLPMTNWFKNMRHGWVKTIISRWLRRE